MQAMCLKNLLNHKKLVVTYRESYTKCVFKVYPCCSKRLKIGSLCLSKFKCGHFCSTDCSFNVPIPLFNIKAKPFNSCNFHVKLIQLLRTLNRYLNNLLEFTSEDH